MPNVRSPLPYPSWCQSGPSPEAWSLRVSMPIFSELAPIIEAHTKNSPGVRIRTTKEHYKEYCFIN